VITVNAPGTHQIIAAVNGVNSLTVQNTQAGANAYAAVNVGNDVGPNTMQILAYSSTYSGSGFNAPNSGSVACPTAGGLTLLANHASGMIRFYTGGLGERVRIAPTGELCVGTFVNPALGQLFVATDGTVHGGVIIQNTNPSNTIQFVYFVNSGNGSPGGIQQTSASTVAYNTTSDARLKTDRGRVVDLSALRGVVVHDFTWTADGVRDRGVFAQEAAAVFPRAVTEGTDDETPEGQLARPWMTDYSKFVPDLIAGFQQHDAELAALRAAFATLKG